MMRVSTLLFSFCIFGAIAGDKVVGRLYLNVFMGHLHKNPTKMSSSLTTMQCGHSVKVIESDGVSTPKNWIYAKVGDDKGFVHSEILSSSRPECFQEKYPRFYNTLNLDLTDMYYWGRLNDHYSSGKSKVN